MPIRINPGDTVPLELSEEERSLILRETFLSLEVMNRLRLATVKGTNLLVRLTLDDLDELAGAVAAQANHCRSKHPQREWDRIFERVQNTLETYTDEESGSEEFSSLLPPDLTERLRSVLQDADLRNLDELNAVVADVMTDYNRQPHEELGGLSPEQMRHLIYDDWESPDGAVRLNASLSLDDLQNSSLLVNARTFLSTALEDGGSVKATSSGNVNRKFVARMMQDFAATPGFDEYWLKYKTTFNEDDFFPVHLVRLLLYVAGLLRKQKAFFRVTKKYESLARAEHAGELFVLLFKSHFKKLSLAYLDGYPENPALQGTAAYTLYALSRQVNDWQTPQDLAPHVFTAVVYEDASLAMESRDFAALLETRILWTLERFGLLESEELPNEKGCIRKRCKYRKTPLYDSFLRFHIPGHELRH